MKQNPVYDMSAAVSARAHIEKAIRDVEKALDVAGRLHERYQQVRSAQGRKLLEDARSTARAIDLLERASSAIRLHLWRAVDIPPYLNPRRENGRKASIYAVVFEDKHGEHISKYFTRLVNARRWAKWLQKHSDCWNVTIRKEK